jgi:hypothetical protein
VRLERGEQLTRSPQLPRERLVKRGSINMKEAELLGGIRDK